MKSIQAVIDVPQVSFTPQSNAQLQAQIEASLRPGVNLAIARRKEQTATNRAEIDADAYARGMGSSTYVTDVKDRQMDAEADDIGTMESSYAAAVASALMDAIAQERAMAMQAEQYNAQMQAAASQLAFSTAQSGYAEYLTAAQAAAAAKSGGGSKKTAVANVAATLPANMIYEFLDQATPQERYGYYCGTSKGEAALRETIIASIGEQYYAEAQFVFPAGK